MRRPRTPRTALIVDPHTAFRARARRDRAKLIRLSTRLRPSTAWGRAAVSLAAIEGLAHGLAGASGVFGFAALGEAAARLERLLERWRLQAPPRELSPQRMTAVRRRLEPVLDRLAAASGRQGHRD